MCATRTQRIFWACLLFWCLMIPVIVIPIVLTTRKVGVAFQSAQIVCTPLPSQACGDLADGSSNAKGLNVNLTFTVMNPNYRPGSSGFNVILYGSANNPPTPLSPSVGYPIAASSVVAKGNTTISVAVPTLYPSGTQPGSPTKPSDLFFPYQVYNYVNPAQPITHYTVYIVGSMQTSIGHISTQSLDFNFTYTFPGA